MATPENIRAQQYRKRKAAKLTRWESALRQIADPTTPARQRQGIAREALGEK